MIHRCTIDKGEYKTLSAKYSAGDFDGEPLDNLKEVREWRNKHYDIVRSLPKEEGFKILSRETQLYQDNRANLLRIFGNPDFTWTGEFRFNCYCLELNDDSQYGIRVLVLTAAGKGTCYELIQEEGVPKRKDLAVTFLEEMINILNEKNIITEFKSFK